VCGNVRAEGKGLRAERLSKELRAKGEQTNEPSRA
jgi:hypothetical protein